MKLKEHLMKNLLAVIGLCVVLQKSYAFYREYSDLKRDNQSRRSHA